MSPKGAAGCQLTRQGAEQRGLEPPAHPSPGQAPGAAAGSFLLHLQCSWQDSLLQPQLLVIIRGFSDFIVGNIELPSARRPTECCQMEAPRCFCEGREDLR